MLLTLHMVLQDKKREMHDIVWGNKRLSDCSSGAFRDTHNNNMDYILRRRS